MTTLAFVLFWLLVGVGLLFVALSGGPRGARERLYSQSHAGRRLSYVLFAVALLAFGIAIPGAVIAVVKDRNDIPEANVSNLTAQEKRGQELFGQRCRNCHTLKAAQATAKVGPNLDQLAPTKALILDAIHKGRANGNGNMAANLVEGADAEAVAQFVAVAVGNPAK
jgi:mono/diheme cytochrome c family protein